jgi:hypothetical protein
MYDRDANLVRVHPLGLFIALLAKDHLAPPIADNAVRLRMYLDVTH